MGLSGRFAIVACGASISWACSQGFQDCTQTHTCVSALRPEAGAGGHDAETAGSGGASPAGGASAGAGGALIPKGAGGTALGAGGTPNLAGTTGDGGDHRNSDAGQNDASDGGGTVLDASSDASAGTSADASALDASDASNIGKAPCDATHLDCDLNPRNGCEVDVGSDAANCGACKYACSQTHASSAACVNGACTAVCSAGFASCGHPTRPAADDGCETDLGTPSSCGACGHDCGGATCSAAHACNELPIATGIEYPQSVTVDATYVHWTQFSSGKTGFIMRSPVRGGQITTVASNQGDPWAMANDGTYIYWCDRAPTAASIRRLLIGTAGDGTSLIADPGTVQMPSPIAVDGTNIYWTDYQIRQVFKMPKDGTGTPTALTSILDIAPYDMAADGASVFYSGPYVIPASATDATAITHFPDGRSDFIAFDATYVYYVAMLSGVPTYARRLKTAAGTTQAIAKQGTTTRAMAVDAAYLYFAEDDGIYRVPKTGGTPIRISVSVNQVTRMVVAGTALYWTNSGSLGSANGSVVKLAL